MRYIGNPVEVDAEVIASVGPIDDHGGRYITLDSGEGRYCDAGMLARMTPQAGDYYVVQADGYAYLNPQDVFERKYHAAPEF